MPVSRGAERRRLARKIRRRLPDLPAMLASGYSHVLAQEGGHGFELLHNPYSRPSSSRASSKGVARQRG